MLTTQTCSVHQSNVLLAINDSQTKKTFENAHSVNCSLGHSFSLVTIQKIFGELKNGVCENPGPCPDCTNSKENITHYIPNTRLQQLVNAVLNPKILLKENVLLEQKDEIYAYPFQPFVFNLQPKEEKERQGCSKETWSLIFKAKDIHSLIQGFQIFISIQDPYWNKDLEDPIFILNIYLSDYLSAEKLTVYAINQGIEAKRSEQCVMIDTTKRDAYLKFINIFMTNNTFGEHDMKKYKEEIDEMLDALEYSTEELQKNRKTKNF